MTSQIVIRVSAVSTWRLQAIGAFSPPTYPSNPQVRFFRHRKQREYRPGLQ
jgi:hypothetical protein